VQLRLAEAVPAGTTMRCSKCGTYFQVGGSPPAEAAPPAAVAKDTFAFAAAADRQCPICKAVLSQDAAACQACGANLVGGAQPTGGSKRAKPPPLPRRTRRSDDDDDDEDEEDDEDEDEEVVDEEIAAVLHEADAVIEEAVEVLGKPLPMLRDFDPVSFTLRANSRLLASACDMPHCRSKQPKARGEQLADRRRLVVVTVPAAMLPKVGHKYKDNDRVVLNVCAPCQNQLMLEFKVRQDYATDQLEPTYQELHKVKAQIGGGNAIAKRIEVIETLTARVQIKLHSGRKCFIATASFGSPFAAEVETLRQYRDVVLRRSRLGRWLIRCYETLSPPLAVWLERSRHGRALVRWMLRPVVVCCARQLGARRQSATKTHC
jgi:hypothetical protein